MSSEKHMRERQFDQVYGVRNAEPLRISIIDEESSGDKDALVYLLIHDKEGPVSAVGFADINRSFTFAFTTSELAGSFVSVARTKKLLCQVGRILPMTVGEYFERKKQGWTKSDLCIDPNPDMLSHPNVKLGIQLSN